MIYDDQELWGEAAGLTRNHLLRALSKADVEILLQGATPVQLEAGTALNEPGVPVTDAIFVEEGIASLMLSSGDQQIEVAVVGREGALGLPAALEQDVTLCQTICVTAVSGHRVPSGALSAAMDARPTIREVINRFVHLLMLQVGYGAIAAATLPLRDRLARFLLMAHDRRGGQDMVITHDEIARTLCVRRPGITVAIHELEGEHCIRSTRGKLSITDRDKLALRAGPSYGIVEELRSRLIETHPEGAPE